MYVELITSSLPLNWCTKSITKIQESFLPVVYYFNIYNQYHLADHLHSNTIPYVYSHAQLVFFFIPGKNGGNSSHLRIAYLQFSIPNFSLTVLCRCQVWWMFNGMFFKGGGRMLFFYLLFFVLFQLVCWNSGRYPKLNVCYNILIAIDFIWNHRT